MQRLMRAAIGTQQHRQLLARLPLADLVRAAQVVRPLGRDRLLRRHRPRRRGDPDRREPDRRRHPVVGARIKQAALRGTKLITIDPRRIELADYGVLHLRPRPGTNAAVHARHRARRSTATGSSTRASSTRAPRATTTLAELLPAYTPDEVEEITGVPAADVERGRAHLRRGRATPAFIWGLGVTEHKYGSEVVQLICNVALMTGKVGRPGSALLPLRGQNNVQGSSDMGALPDTYTAYRSVGDEDGRARRSRQRGA